MLSVGAPKLLSVLAVLLLHPNRVVTEERLFALVWGEQPPQSVKGRLRVYISELRALLGHGVILRAGGGYQMNVAPGQLDLQIFTEAVARGRIDLRAGRAQAAAARLRAAVALWSGPALGGVTLELAAQERRGLDEHRIVALEELFEAELAAGQHDKIVAELRLACAEHPFRERFTAQLMLALHRSGRTAEALDLYTEIHRKLVDELGIGPGRDLRAMQSRVLTDDADTPQRADKGRPRLLDDRTADPDQGERQRTWADPSAAAWPGPTLPSGLLRTAGVLVGRRVEIKRVITAMREAPLVTLTGVGGVGKSRLALEVAQQDQPHFPDGVWVCELAPVPDGGSVGRAVAVALHVEQRHGLTIEQSLIEYLSPRKLLLVMDNCEHVLDEASRLLANVVSRCPKVVVLATSREALGVQGERVWPVPPLASEDATALFVRRARAVCPSFHPDREIKAHVAQICRRLDGLPLAIELAAARIPVMTAAEVADRLTDKRLLASRSRMAEPRHQSLTTAIDWSYRLLCEPEQRLFDRLSVFAGSADLAAVHAVCAEPERTEADTLDLLAALVAKSMVVAERGLGGTRYRLLETLRAYGRDRLSSDGSLARRHAEHFVAVAERAARGVQCPDERMWIDRVLPDADNLRMAFHRAIADRNADLAMRLVTSLPELVQARLGWEAFAWAEQALSLAHEDHPLYVAALGAAARDAWGVGDSARARKLAARAGGRVPGRGTARFAYPADVAADVALYEDDVDTALDHYSSQVALARRVNDPIRLADTLHRSAVCQAARHVPELGLACAMESVEVAMSTGNPTALSMARYALGLVLKRSDPDRALLQLDEAAALAASVRNFFWQGSALMEAGSIRAVHGDPAVAARMLLDVLDHCDLVGDRTQLWLCLRYIIRLLIRLGAESEAAALYYYLVAARRPPSLSAERTARLAASLGAVRFDAAAARGSQLSAASAAALARSCLRRTD